MRVLAIVLDNRMGGIQVRVLTIAGYLRPQGVETVIAAPKGGGGFAQRAQKAGFRAHQILLDYPSFSRPFATLRWLATFPLSVVSLAVLIRKEKIAIVHANGLLCLQGPIAAVLTRRKVVWHLPGVLYPPWLVRVLMPIVSRVGTRLVFTSEAGSEFYLRYSGARAKARGRIVRGLVDLSRFTPTLVTDREVAELRDELGVSSQSPVVGVVGNINPLKGYEYLLQAMHEVVNERPEVKLVIVGAPLETQKAYYQGLQDTIGSLGLSGNVVFAGPRHDIPRVLKTFDLFVLPSISEGNPLVVLEAMAMELPVVASAVGGVIEMIRSGVNGLLVPPSDPGRLAEAIREMLSDASRAREMGRRGRAIVEEKFGAQACVEGHRQVYEMALSDV